MPHPIPRATRRPIRRRVGFTLIELLVVISIIAVLAGMLIPAVTLVQGRVRLADCGNNQRQIAVAMVAYAGSEGANPLGTVAGIAPLVGVATANEAATVTYRTFEVLAAFASLPPRLFKCRSSVLPMPSARPAVDATSDAWGRGRIGYALDWSAPGESAAYRVLTADRTSDHHQDVVMASFADGHAATLRTGSPLAAGAGTCEGAKLGAVNGDAIGTDRTSGPGADPSAADDIFTSARDGADGGDPALMTAGAGSPRRAMVR
jgi:prepilin-type N-terminal cleavage/methylation domain-containing protein